MLLLSSLGNVTGPLLAIANILIPIIWLKVQIIQAKSRHMTELFADAKNPAQFLRAVRTVTDTRSPLPSLKRPDGLYAVSSPEKAELLADFFASVFKIPVTACQHLLLPMHMWKIAGCVNLALFFGNCKNFQRQLMQGWMGYSAFFFEPVLIVWPNL